MSFRLGCWASRGVLRSAPGFLLGSWIGGIGTGVLIGDAEAVEGMEGNGLSADLELMV